METKKQKTKNLNYYKIATYSLLTVVILISAFFLLNYYGNAKINQGAILAQQAIGNTIFAELNEKGYITFNLGENESLTLVPSAYVQKAREETIIEIMDLVKKEGSITLYNNETQLILIPYEQPQQSELSNLDMIENQ